MKKIILWSSCVLLFLLTTACTKESETISLLSSNTWVVSSNSAGGLVGDEYKFYDTRLYLHTESGFIKNDGKWSFSSDYTDDGILVESDLGDLYFDVRKITNNELELAPIDASSSVFSPLYLPTITLTAKR